MRKIFQIFLVITVIFAFSGCASRINQVMKSWEGQHRNDLIASWGPPQQIMSDGQGGEIFVYTQVKQWTTPGQATTDTTASANIYGNQIYGSGTSRTTYNPPKTYGYQAQRVFWIDKDGYIYRWSWKGL